MKGPKLTRDPYGLVGTALAHRYHLEELVGIGGMGVVYRARHLVTTATVAVKVLKPDLALADPELVEAFFKEAKATVGLDHPYIVRVTDAAMTDDGLPFLVMEWLSGHTLEEEIRRRGPLPPEQVATFLEQIGEALAHAHARGIVHRDLKPANFMLVTDYKGELIPKILDFGIAKVLHSTVSARVSRAMGTVHYASPEQFRAGAAIDHRSDIYSLGIVAYQMLTGRVPFDAASVERVIYEHLHVPPPSPRDFRPDLPPAVEDVLERALAKDPEARFSSALELARAFRHAIGRGGGELRLECRDAGTRAPVAAALIYLDGRYAGQTDAEGKWTVRGLAARPHIVEVASPRHHLWRETVSSERGGESVLLVELNPLPLGSILLQCAVAHAEVFLDGVRVSVTDERGACVLDRIRAGRHRLTVRHPQYAPTHIECDVVEGEMLPLVLTLRPRRGRIFARLAHWRKKEGATARATATEEKRSPSSAIFDTLADAATQRITPAAPTEENARPRVTARWWRSRRALAGGIVGLGLAGFGLALWLWRGSEDVPSPAPEVRRETTSAEPVSPPSPPPPEPSRRSEAPSAIPIRRPSSAIPSLTSPPQAGSPAEAAPVKEPSSRIEETTSASPLAIAEHVRRGNEHFTAGRYDDALREYRAAQKLDPSNPDVYYLIGLVHERRGEYEAAREAFQQCTDGPYAAVARNHVKMLEKKRPKPKP